MSNTIELQAATEPLPMAVPVEYAGQWVAWDREQAMIVGHGPTWIEARKTAADAGFSDVVLQKVPRSGVVFIGARR